MGSDYNGVFTFLNAVNTDTAAPISSLMIAAFPLGSIAALNNHWAIFPTAIDAPEVPGFIIYRLDTATAEPQPHRIIEFDQLFFGLTISEIGDQVAFGIDRDAGFFGVFDVEQGRVIYTGQTEESIRDLLFNPDGNLLAVTTHSRSRYTQDVEIWDAELMVRLDTISVSSAVVE